MRLNFSRTFATGILLVGLTLACRTSDILIAELQPTATPTRRPTATPIPPTRTPTPQPSPSPTNTRPPTTRPTPRPPTAVPPPPAPAVAAFPYTYHAQYQGCQHAGDTYIKGAVYRDRNDPNSKISGAIMVFSGAPDGEAAGVVRTEDTYTFILRAQGAYPGNFFVWVANPSLKRISEMSPMITFNDKKPSDPSACWAAIVDFWLEPGR